MVKGKVLKLIKLQREGFDLILGHKRMKLFHAMWVWLKIKQEGLRRFWFMFPLTRVPYGCFGVCCQPLGGPGSVSPLIHLSSQSMMLNGRGKALRGFRLIMIMPPNGSCPSAPKSGAAKRKHILMARIFQNSWQISQQQPRWEVIPLWNDLPMAAVGLFAIPQTICQSLKRPDLPISPPNGPSRLAEAESQA